MQQNNVEVQPFSYFQEKAFIVIAVKRFQSTKRPIQGLLLVQFQI